MSTPPDPKKNIENIYPLVPMQQGLLFHALLSPADGSYLPQIVLTLRGDLDAHRLRDAWQATLDRHPALRSAFHWEQREQPFQVVHRGLALPWVEQDWQDLPPDAQAARLQALLAAQRAQPFDLRRPPLMRLVCVRLGAERHHLVWSHHHLLLDGWSASLVLRDVFARYLGAPVPPAPRPYADFVAWQLKQDRPSALAYWQTALQGVQPAAPLPMLRHARSTGAARPARCEQEISSGDTARLRRFAQHRGLTLSTLVQGALGLLLRRYGQGDDIVFGTTVAGRPADLPGAMGMVGLFINTVPVRLRMNPAEHAGDWLARIQAARFAAADHEHLPLREVQAQVLPEGATAGGRLFDCLLVIESYPTGGELLPGQTGLGLEGLAVEESTHFGLTLQVTDGDPIRLVARYDARRADASAMTALLGHLSRALLALAEQPDAPVGRLSLLAPPEREQLQQWRHGPVAQAPAHTTGQTLADRFEAQAARSPDHQAIVDHTGVLTYRQLDRRANALAHALRERGVGADDTVAVHIERSMAMVVAVLAIQKAGAAYLPLDPDQPAARLQAMLADAAPKALLVDEAAGLPPLPQHGHLPRLDAAAERAEHDTPPARHTLPGHAAYVIYTSGSTGRPKGVVNHHAGILNRLDWMQRHFGLRADDRVVQKTPLGFDVSVWELFWPLCEGATLVLARPGAHRDRDQLADLIHQERITVAHFVPAMLADFLQVPDLTARCARLRHLICSGEALSAPLQRQVFEDLPGVALHNLYGPTEAAVDVSVWRCDPASGDEPVPIGRPIDGITLQVLDIDGQPAPVGVPGRLFIGGIGVARGYLGRAGLTAERFVPDPLTVQGSIPLPLYDTGDLARWRADGALDYLGRADDQVKLRGVRLELGEVEATLLAVPSVRQALVKLWPDTPGGPQLVGYVVPTTPGAWGDAPGLLLQGALRERLPEAMVPSRFVLLDALPIGPSGKPDRRALQPPAMAGDRVHVAPRNPVEQGLADIWRDTLRLALPPGVHDNFFELGGHSLVAMRVVTRVRSVFGVELPLTSAFEHPTLESLAVAVQSRLVPPPPSGPAPSASPVPGWRDVEI